MHLFSSIHPSSTLQEAGKKGLISSQQRKHYFYISRIVYIGKKERFVNITVKILDIHG